MEKSDSLVILMHIRDRERERGKEGNENETVYVAQNAVILEDCVFCGEAQDVGRSTERVSACTGACCVRNAPCESMIPVPCRVWA